MVNIRRVLVLGSFLLLVGCAHAPQKGARSQEEPSGIVVVGEGRASAVPDRAVFTVGVESRRASLAEAREANAEALSRVLEALRGAGIEDADIQTANISAGPDYVFGESGRSLVGYVATNSVSVRTMRLDRVSGALDAGVAAGGEDARLDGLRFEVVDLEVPRGEARARAVANAKVRAEQLAASGGVRLGDLVAIEEMAPGGAPGPMHARMAMTQAESATPIQTGSTEVVVEVRARWEIRR